MARPHTSVSSHTDRFTISFCPHRSPLQRTTNSPSSPILCGIIAMEGDFMRARSTPRLWDIQTSGRLSTMHPIASHDVRSSTSSRRPYHTQYAMTSTRREGTWSELRQDGPRP